MTVLARLASFSLDDASSKSTPASYHVYTDGTTIYGIPQQNPVDSNTLAKVTDTDIGDFLKEIFINQLPPQGTDAEAAGKVKFKRGEYPGTLDNVPLGRSLHLEGEMVNHYIDGGRDGREFEKPAVLMRGEAGTSSFTPPEDIPESESSSPFVMLENLSFIGPGNDSTGSFLYNSEAASGVNDWIEFHRVTGHEYESFLQCLSLDNQLILDNCHFLDFGNNGQGFGVKFKTGHVRIDGSEWWTYYDAGPSVSTDGATAGHIFGGSKFVHLNTPASGAAVIALDGEVNVTNCLMKYYIEDRVGILSGDGESRISNNYIDGGKYGVRVSGDGGDTVINNYFHGCGTAVLLESSGSRDQVV